MLNLISYFIVFQLFMFLRYFFLKIFFGSFKKKMYFSGLKQNENIHTTQKHTTQ